MESCLAVLSLKYTDKLIRDGFIVGCKFLLIFILFMLEGEAKLQHIFYIVLSKH